MRKIFINSFLILLLTFIFLEIASILLIKINLLPNGITPRVTIIPHKNFGFWHHKNKSFRLASECWSSKVSYNNHGMRQVSDINIDLKTKKRIALIGDSMTENLEVTDGNDFGSLIQSKLPDYEILNFSVRSTGLGDHIELYEGLIKNFELDYIFLFISDNDLEDNYYLNNRPSQNKYKVINDKIKKLPIDERFFEKQKKISNKLKKEQLIFVKEYFRSYILYSHFRANLLYQIYKKKKKDNIERQVNNPYEDYDKKIKIYKHLKTKFLNQLSNNEKLIVFTNPRPKIISEKFYPEKKNIEEMSKIWGDQYIINTTSSSIDYLKRDDKYKYPYFSFECDGHFSAYGANFMSDLVVEKFLEIISSSQS